MSIDEQTEHEQETEPTNSRRALLTKGTVAAAVAAVAGGAMSSKVHAADGQNLVIGQANTGTSTTSLSGDSTLRVTNGTSDGDASIYGTAGGSVASGLYGVRGDNSGLEGAGVYGAASGSGGIGVYGLNVGETVSGTGVRGQVNIGTGVYGLSDSGAGVLGNGTTYDLRAVGSGKIGLAQSTVDATAAGVVGTIARDADGALWYCYATNRWRRLAGTATAGSFVPLSPFRAYDSRQPEPSPGKLTANQTRTISVADARSVNDGSVALADVVPAGATAVAFNITVVNTESGGYLYVADGDATDILASTINWPAPNSVVANSAIVKLNASRQVKVFCGETGATNFIIDVAGYYL